PTVGEHRDPEPDTTTVTLQTLGETLSHDSNGCVLLWLQSEKRKRGGGESGKARGPTLTFPINEPLEGLLISNTEHRKEAGTERRRRRRKVVCRGTEGVILSGLVTFAALIAGSITTCCDSLSSTPAPSETHTQSTLLDFMLPHIPRPLERDQYFNEMGHSHASIPAGPLGISAEEVDIIHKDSDTTAYAHPWLPPSSTIKREH
ncbi:unnamed protein product, partial [Pleuronectes platessa]